MPIPIRPGMTVPLPGPLHSHRDKLGQLADMGYTDIWSAEADGADAFTPLAWIGAHTSKIRLGTAIVQLSARTPTATAMAARTWRTNHRAVREAFWLRFMSTPFVV